MILTRRFIFFLCFVWSFSACAFSKESSFDSDESSTFNRGEVCFKSQYCFNVEVMRNRDEQEKGLMGREFLAKDAGMLFVYKEEGLRNFWMKNMNFPIDMIWLNKNQEVVALYQEAQPCVKEPCQYFRPPTPFSYVLELNSGEINKIGLRKGDQMEAFL